MMSMKRTVTSGSTFVVCLNEVERDSDLSVKAFNCRLLVLSWLTIDAVENK